MLQKQIISFFSPRNTKDTDILGYIKSSNEVMKNKILLPLFLKLSQFLHDVLPLASHIKIYKNSQSTPLPPKKHTYTRIVNPRSGVCANQFNILFYKAGTLQLVKRKTLFFFILLKFYRRELEDIFVLHKHSL